MEKEKEDLKGVYEHIRRVSKPVFEEVLQEELTNSMTTPEKSFETWWRPNNYRRQIKIFRGLNSGAEEIKHTMGSFPVEITFNPHNKLINAKKWKEFPKITLQLGKNTLTAIYSLRNEDNEKVFFHVRSDDVNKICSWVIDKKREIAKNMDLVLNKFIDLNNIRLISAFPEWKRYEDGFADDDTAKLPLKAIIHADVFKKVYKNPSIEYKTSGFESEPVVHVINKLRNNALKDFSPEISAHLSGLKASLSEGFKGMSEVMKSQNKAFVSLSERLIPTIMRLDVNIKSHVKAIRGINNSFERFNKLLEDKERERELPSKRSFINNFTWKQIL